jgi:Rps23 Pro-64 3,4-dihydroxylase Tpa1-like proline 4-hydroxylase
MEVMTFSSFFFVGRRIAYILYLVPEDWSSEDGGALDLFSSQNGQPSKVIKSILPSRNAFAFFEVSPASFHQVDSFV